MYGNPKWCILLYFIWSTHACRALSKETYKRYNVVQEKKKGVENRADATEFISRVLPCCTSAPPCWLPAQLHLWGGWCVWHATSVVHLIDDA